MEPTGPRSVGPYRLVASLGHGGQADVFLAVRRGPSGFSKLIVLKSIRPDLEGDARSRDALIFEARLAAKLQHPNVVQTLEVGDEAGHLYIAMEFLDGQPLSRVVRAAAKAHRELGLPLIGAVLCDMLSGLHSAHELRDYDGRSLEVIHRDVSPQNVFLTYEGEVKLVDFGIAKAATSTDVTDAGVVKGKPSYMAPEQALGKPIDRRADLYAVGIIAWELLTGRRLFYAETAAALALKLVSEDTPPVASIAKVPPLVAAVVDKALAKDRDQRYATAAELRAALERALEVSGVRKAERDEVGRFVAELFERERSWLRGRIKESVAAAEAEQTPVTLPTLQPGDLHTLPKPEPARKSRRWLAALALVPLLALAALWRLRTPAAGAADLRLCGSNTIGTELAPALVDAFVKRKGERPPAFNIDTSGTVTAFPLMTQGRCDVGMLSRPMSDEERKTFPADLRAPATEHVIGLDGIAVIVHPNNRVRSLSVEQIKGIFTGAIRDWSEVGGAKGPIDVYARDEGSSTWDTFKHLALGSGKLSSAAHQIADSNELSDKVATEPAAIGFVGLVYVHSSNAVAVGATVPSPFTVADESYPLTRRLYFYTLPKPASKVVTEFVNFVLSAEGQEVVRQKGFVDLSIAARTPDARGARRLTVDFRFRPGSSELDSRAIRDLDRLVAFLRANSISRLSLVSFGGDARTVVAELERRGVKPEAVSAGAGSQRRVEVWVR